jgi:hypothetical protein
MATVSEFQQGFHAHLLTKSAEEALWRAIFGWTLMTLNQLSCLISVLSLSSYLTTDCYCSPPYRFDEQSKGRRAQEVTCLRTFVERHVHTLVVSAEWLRPAWRPGNVVEDRVVWPVQAAVVFIRVESQPPVVALYLCLRVETKTFSILCLASCRGRTKEHFSMNLISKCIYIYILELSSD